ncbi:MAG: diphthamide biosynthesis enzyme Dph2 [Desulfurococcales archaeon]|nr:diphthamide biosynthesis enzyme Dph2 [Desulfurococcales archaeon]
MLGGFYSVDLSPLESKLRDGGFSLLILQLPDGLKRFFPDLVNCISRLGHENIIIHGDSVYGACDLQLGKLSLLGDLDRLLVVHVAHTPYPPELASVRVASENVVYLGARSLVAIDEALLEDTARTLKDLGARRVALVATAQHLHELGAIAGFLAARGFKAVVPRGRPPYLLDGQVIGCDYRVARSAGTVDSYVIVSGGFFHPLGLYLATLRHVVHLDPYESKVKLVDEEGERVLRRRLYLVSKAMEGSTVGIIIGLKEGQYRPRLLQSLIESARRKGLQAVLIAAEYTSPETLDNIDNNLIDFYVITSCPRLAIDDLGDYRKPVLTPGEAFMALEGSLHPYRFPW